MHQRLRYRALAKNHELRSKLVWVRSVELLKKRAKQRATFFLVGNRNLVSGMVGVGQLRNRVHKRTAAITIASHRFFKPIEIPKDLPGWGIIIGYFDWA